MPVKNVGITPVSVYRAPAYHEPYRTITITNTDSENPVYYSDGPGTIDAQSSFIPPRGTETFDGAGDVWISTLSDLITVAVQLKIGSSSFNPATVNNFNQVNIQHVASSAVVNAGSAMLKWAPSPIPVTAQGYLIALRGQNLGDLYACDVQIDHLGPEGNLVGTEYFTVSNYVGMESAGNFHQVAIRGKLIGSTVEVSVFNANNSWWQTVTNTSLTVSAWVQAVFYVVPFDYPGESQIIGSFNSRVIVPGTASRTITASGTLDICASYEGMASGFVINLSPASAVILFKLQSYTVQNGTTALANVWFPQLSQSQSYNGLFAINNLFNTVGVTLVSGASATLQYGITAVD